MYNLISSINLDKLLAISQFFLFFFFLKKFFTKLSEQTKPPKNKNVQHQMKKPVEDEEEEEEKKVLLVTSNLPRFWLQKSGLAVGRLSSSRTTDPEDGGRVGVRGQRGREV